MKKVFYSMIALSAVLFGACSQEENFGAADGEATVSFTLSTPEIATRAYSDGATATVLQYAVYNSAGEQLTDLTKSVANQNAEEIHGSKTVELKLTTGNTYSVIFWAAAPNAPYSVDFATKTMTVDYTAAKTLCNDENRDAFFKCDTFVVNGSQNKVIELKRPFAQLNVGTSDYAASKSAGYVPVESSVTVKNIYTTLNLANGAVDGETAVTFGYNDIPTTETFPVAGYEYISMNYLLYSADKGVIEVDFSYTETDAAAAKTRTVGSVPVQRNHRTNIYGQLLTSDVVFNVVIEPDYDEPAYEADALLLAAACGGKVTLTEDVVLTEPLNVVSGMVLDLNGKKLTGSVNVAEDVSFTVENGTIENSDENVSGIISNGDLTLNNMNITSARHALRIESGSVVINGGTYKVAPASNKTLHALNVGDDGTVANVIIKGGTFVGPKGTIADSGSAVSVKAGSSVTIEGGDFSGGKNNTLSSKGTMTVSGGSFDQDPTAFLADGLKAIENGDRWYVAAEEFDKVAKNADELIDALTNGEDVMLLNNVKIDPAGMSNAYGTTGINVTNGQTIDGGGNVLDIKGAGGTWDSGINTTGGVIKNITVTGSFRGIFINHNSTHQEKVVLENVIIYGTTYTISCDQGTGEGLDARNCTFKGWTSYAATLGVATFRNCYFGAGNGYSYCRPYAVTEFTKCEFEAGYTIDPCATVVFDDCTFGGEPLTDANIANLVTNVSKVTIK